MLIAHTTSQNTMFLNISHLKESWGGSVSPLYGSVFIDNPVVFTVTLNFVLNLWFFYWLFHCFNRPSYIFNFLKYFHQLLKPLLLHQSLWMWRFRGWYYWSKNLLLWPQFHLLQFLRVYSCRKIGETWYWTHTFWLCWFIHLHFLHNFTVWMNYFLQ